MKKAMLVDGNSLLFRSYYGTIQQVSFYLKNNIFPANAIKTMMQIIFKIFENNKYDYLVMAFDHKDKNFRKKEFEDYKGTRKETPKELINQIEPIKEIMSLFGFNVLCISGIEADDIIGSASKLLSKNDIKCEIYSSDNDMLQLVDKNISVIQFKKGITEFIVHNIDNFLTQNNNLKPMQIIDYKAICGDKSDNIPGIKGIGEKSAISLLQKFNSLDEIYENIEFIDSKTLKEKLISGKNDGYMSKKLATILTNYFDDKDISFFEKRVYDLDSIKQKIKEFKFSGFSKYIGDK